MRIHPGADRAGDLARMVAEAEAKKKTEGLLPPGQDKGPLPGREGGAFQHQAPPPQGGGGERERSHVGAGKTVQDPAWAGLRDEIIEEAKAAGIPVGGLGGEGGAPPEKKA